jgi:hypothetical protein
MNNFMINGTNAENLNEPALDLPSIEVLASKTIPVTLERITEEYMKNSSHHSLIRTNRTPELGVVVEPDILPKLLEKLVSDTPETQPVFSQSPDRQQSLDHLKKSPSSPVKKILPRILPNPTTKIPVDDKKSIVHSFARYIADEECVGKENDGEEKDLEKSDGKGYGEERNSLKKKSTYTRIPIQKLLSLGPQVKEIEQFLPISSDFLHSIIAKRNVPPYLVEKKMYMDNKRKQKGRPPFVISSAKGFVEFLITRIIRCRRGLKLNAFQTIDLRDSLMRELSESDRMVLVSILKENGLFTQVYSKTVNGRSEECGDQKSEAEKIRDKLVSKSNINVVYGITEYVAPSKESLEWAAERGWNPKYSSRPPTISRREDTALLVLALLVVIHEKNDFPEWIKKPYIEQRRMEMPNIQNLYHLLNRIISILSLRNTFDMKQPLIHNLSFQLLEILPEDVRSELETLINTKFPKPKPQRTLDTFVSKKRKIEKDEIN